MDITCTLQIFIDGSWHDAALVTLTGDTSRGVDASTYLEYLVEYATSHLGRRDAAALSVSTPVDLQNQSLATWPPFLIDLLPQGYGRAELLRQLHHAASAGASADWNLLCAGAGNPIGNVRVKEAYQWTLERSGNAPYGFSMDEVASRAGDFNEYLAQHGLFLAGSSGIQGEWPKILLTRASDSLYYLDHTLPDERAEQHFIVKFGRCTDPALADILRLEAPYMQLAKGLGLHVHAELTLRGRALFIPRFDRHVSGGQVNRHGQESVASLCGITGFGGVPSHNQVCRRLSEVASDPAREVIEYIKRDIASVVLGNKDNHARNTAIHRRADGTVGLTPLFDFAPMWLHPDGIARRIRWERDDGGSPDWASAIDQASDAALLDNRLVRAGVATLAAPLSGLFDTAGSLGIEERFLAPLARTWEKALRQLEKL